MYGNSYSASTSTTDVIKELHIGRCRRGRLVVPAVVVIPAVAVLLGIGLGVA